MPCRGCIQSKYWPLFWGHHWQVPIVMSDVYYSYTMPSLFSLISFYGNKTESTICVYSCISQPWEALRSFSEGIGWTRSEMVMGIRRSSTWLEKTRLMPRPGLPRRWHSVTARSHIRPPMQYVMTSSHFRVIPDTNSSCNTANIQCSYNPGCCMLL